MFKVSSLAIYGIEDIGYWPGSTVEYILTISTNQYIQKATVRKNLDAVYAYNNNVTYFWEALFYWGS